MNVVVLNLSSRAEFLKKSNARVCWSGVLLISDSSFHIVVILVDLFAIVCHSDHV